MDKLLRTRLTTALVLTVVFVSGLLLGMAADRSMAAAPAAERGRSDEPENQGRRRPLWEQVGPSEDQKITIDSIVSEYQTAMKALHAEFNAAYDPRYRALLAETRAAIKGVLTPEQAQAYDSLAAKRDRQRAERDSGGDRE